MAYLVKLIVYTNDDSALEERLKGAISKAGGAIRQNESTQTSADAKEHYFSLKIEDTSVLPAIVRAVEGVRGAAVMAVTEPREIKGMHRV